MLGQWMFWNHNGRQICRRTHSQIRFSQDAGEWTERLPNDCVRPPSTQLQLLAMQLQQQKAKQLKRLRRFATCFCNLSY